MATLATKEQKKTIVKDFKKGKRELDIFMPSMITKRVSLPMSIIGKNIKPILEKISGNLSQLSSRLILSTIKEKPFFLSIATPHP